MSGPQKGDKIGQRVIEPFGICQPNNRLTTCFYRMRGDDVLVSYPSGNVSRYPVKWFWEDFHVLIPVPIASMDWEAA